MVSSVAQYILSVKYLDLMSRSLGSRRISPIFVENDNEKLRCMVGNSAIVFEVMFEGRKMALRVYMRKHPNLQAIYGDRYYPKELLVHSSHTDYTLADVVLCDWYEGESLQRKIEQCYDKPSKMRALSKMFEEFAISLLDERWAHGDMKPENIILSRDGLHLIDFDAMYREGFTSDDCVEIGTQQFQHPLRDKSTFSRDIDDYPIALITTALAAMALDSSIGRNIPEIDHLLIRPELAVKGEDEMLQRIEALFAKCGDVRHYRIAKLLRSPRPELPQLKSLLELKTQSSTTTEHLTLEYYNGYWGYALDGRFVIPPLYDLAFEFSEGLALVSIGGEWHFIDETGAVRISCGRGRGIKPFRNGATRILREDGEFAIYSDGRIDKIL